MNQQTNIENYRRSFNIMAKNLDNNLKDYLTEHKMTKIELLLRIGLNTKLVTEFNYTELEKLVSLILTDEEFPIITNHSEGDDISIFNKKTKHDLKISDDCITFDLSKESELSKEINLITYKVESNNLKRINTNIDYSIDETSNFVNNVIIKINEIKYSVNGEVLEDNSCEILLKNPILISVFKRLYKSTLSQNIAFVLNKIIELINEKKITKEDIEIKLNSLDKSIK